MQGVHCGRCRASSWQLLVRWGSVPCLGYRVLVVVIAAWLLGGCMWASPLKLRSEYTAQRPSPPPVPDNAPGILVVTKVPTGAQVLGEYFIEADHGFFHNYESEWRNPYCGSQRPLVFLTLFVFELFPTYWPCYKHSHYPVSKLEAAAVELARKRGGNAVLVRYEDRDDNEAKSVSGSILAIGATGPTGP